MPFLKNGKKIKVLDHYIETSDSLENRNYILQIDQFGVLYLEEYNDFNMPEKLYGDVETFHNLVMQSFRRSNKSLGILLSGLKGTGKSVQMKYTASKAEMPVIIINNAYDGPQLISFFEEIRQSCVVLIDEFEKVFYQETQQNSILPLFDGLSNTKHLFILTVNGEVSPFLMGRPSRIRYNKNYQSMSNELIADLTNDRLKNIEMRDQIIDFVKILPDVSIDTLNSIVDESNFYPDKSLQEILEFFNIDNPLNQKFHMHINIPIIAVKEGTEYEIIDDIKTDLENEGFGDTLYSGTFEETEYKKYVHALNTVARKYPQARLTNAYFGGEAPLTYIMDRLGNSQTLSLQLDKTEIADMKYTELSMVEFIYYQYHFQGIPEIELESSSTGYQVKLGNGTIIKARKKYIYKSSY